MAVGPVAKTLLAGGALIGMGALGASVVMGPENNPEAPVQCGKQGEFSLDGKENRIAVKLIEYSLVPERGLRRNTAPPKMALTRFTLEKGGVLRVESVPEVTSNDTINPGGAPLPLAGEIKPAATGDNRYPMTPDGTYSIVGALGSPDGSVIIAVNATGGTSELDVTVGVSCTPASGLSQQVG